MLIMSKVYQINYYSNPFMANSKFKIKIALGSQLPIAALNLTSAYRCDAEALILSLEVSA
jgi:hypothetical protein